jgi:hypothetical protein
LHDVNHVLPGQHPVDEPAATLVDGIVADFVLLM